MPDNRDYQKWFSCGGISLCRREGDWSLEMSPNGESKKINKSLVQIIAWMALAAFLFIKDVMPMLTGGGKTMSTAQLEQTVNVNGQRISRLEAMMEILVSVPQTVASQQADLNSIKNMLEKIDMKIDKHMGIR